jgi:hypothetical protein
MESETEGEEKQTGNKNNEDKKKLLLYSLTAFCQCGSKVIQYRLIDSFDIQRLAGRQARYWYTSSLNWLARDRLTGSYCLHSF